MTATETLQRWICESCGFIYDPEEGDPDGGIPPGTPSRTFPTPGSVRCAGAQARLRPLRGLGPTCATRDGLLAFDASASGIPTARCPRRCPPLPVVSAEGVRLTLADGRELIDGMASWWCAIHGYRHPALDAAAREQLGRMAHVMFGGLTHEPAVRLAERLLELAPGPRAGVLRRLRLGLGRGRDQAVPAVPARARAPGRTRLLTVRGGYHGDTFGAMAVCDRLG